MKIAFFASNIVPIHAQSLAERPLGGTETGLIHLASALHQLGNEVTVFSPHENPPQVAHQPKYLHYRNVENLSNVDAFVAIRDWIPLLYKVPTRKRLLWSGDSYDQFSNYGLGDKRVQKMIDALLTVSEWQANTLSAASGFDRNKAWVLGNGIHLANFEGTTEARQSIRMIYSSTPHRGLIHVPALLTELRKTHPDLECHIFSSYTVYDQQNVRKFDELKAELERTPGCVLHPSVLQHELAKEFKKSRILFYPCDYEETSCITAMEAQAAGCVVVSSALAALPETVGAAGVLIDGKPSEPEYRKKYIEACNRILSDDKYFTTLSERGKENMQNKDWLNIAQRFQQFLRA
jgi:glycosyltransferase involved in cell wall biosynthesis